MRHIALAVLLLSTATAQGQDPAPAETPTHKLEGQLVFEHEDECGSPLIESMGWRILEGKAIGVTGGRTFILRTSDGKRIRVDLVALDTSHDEAPARELLSTLIEGQVVTVLINPSAYGNKSVVGEVHAGSQDVNRELLRAGVARFKEPPPYSVSTYTSCIYRITEREARHAKSGS
jgi:hypothetical protein